jgi:hypothetical protein
MRGTEVVFAALGRLMRVVYMVLSEIFEESAYARFLQRQRMGSSREAYAGFLRESQQCREKRARCC